MVNVTKSDVAKFVRDAITLVPPLEGTRLEVDENKIYYTVVDGTKWWRVPIIPTPVPRRRFALYEVMAEIEGVLQDEQGLDILLVSGEPAEDDLAESVLNA